ncbi:hypothetical protein [Croceicoccus sp. Ery15]|uniref:hypothetical protein n=1 Tax=Croceicoccus sp. Ery15 TaxID=1703338 RepID=UPI001E4443AD|nr:hypothetical protein [Croceicoccus sp. Ery15]
MARAARTGLVPLAASLLAPALIVPALSIPGAMAQPVFTGDDPLASDTGQANLTWQADGPVEIAIAGPDGNARPLFGGRGETLFLSGLSDGDYTVSIAPEHGAVTDELVLEVRHQSLSRALLLTLLGGVVFLTVLAVILRGSRGD